MRCSENPGEYMGHQSGTETFDWHGRIQNLFTFNGRTEFRRYEHRDYKHYCRCLHGGVKMSLSHTGGVVKMLKQYSITESADGSNGLSRG